MAATVLLLSPLVAILLVAPIGLNDYHLHIAISSLYYVMMATAWNFLAGRAGIFSLGTHALAGLSAYTSALSILYLGLPLAVSMSLGVLSAGLLSLFLAAITLRMRGIYLALTTWAFAEISRLLLSIEYQFTRGDLGLQTVLLFGLRDLAPYYYLFLGATALILYFLHKLSNSRFGLYILAIGQDPLACSVSGIDVFRWRVIATFVSGIISGFAGVLFGHYIGVLAPSLLGFHEMATIIMMAITGGFGTFLGPVLGAFTVEVLLESFRVYREWRMVAFAIAVIVIVRVYREGLTGLLRKYTPLRRFLS